MNQEVAESLVEAGRGYEKLFVPALFDVWTRHLIEGADVQEGSHVLDIACAEIQQRSRRDPGHPPFGKRSRTPTVLFRERDPGHPPFYSLEIQDTHRSIHC